MAGIGSLIGIGAGLLGNIFGGIGSARQREKAQTQLDNQIKENENLFNKDYYQDILSRSDVQNLLRNTRNRIADANKIASNTAVVTGATPESVAAQKKNYAKAYSDLVSNIASQSSLLKQRAEDRYLANKNILLGQQADLYNDRASQWSNVASNAGNILGAFSALYPLSTNKQSGKSLSGFADNPNEIPKTKNSNYTDNIFLA
ncbi:hypothetical protein [Coprobacter sp.]|uniref:hypothetical protein n=1 Tax=Coprobacter sp. TaxID=1941478 RepID=UPI003AB3890A